MTILQRAKAAIKGAIGLKAIEEDQNLLTFFVDDDADAETKWRVANVMAGKEVHVSELRTAATCKFFTVKEIK